MNFGESGNRCTGRQRADEWTTWHTIACDGRVETTAALAVSGITAIAAIAAAIAVPIVADALRISIADSVTKYAIQQIPCAKRTTWKVLDCASALTQRAPCDG